MGNETINFKKMMKKILVFIIACFSVFYTYAQSDKKFELYDAIAYPGKPDLSSEGLLPVYLMYEATLTKPGSSDSPKLVLDFEKIDTQAKLAAEFPHVMVSTDIEQWFGDSGVDAYEMSSRFNQLFSVFREKNPDVVIGNYGIAPSALCVYRFYDNGQTDDGVLISKWKERNLKRWPSLEHADVCTPSVYIAQPDIDSWIRDLKITVDEIKKHAPGKKIIVYIWPQYYDKPDSPYSKQFLSAEKWNSLLEAVYENCDGAIIWSSVTDENEQVARWNDPRVQEIWNATKNFITVHQDNLVMPLTEPDIIGNDNPDKSFIIYQSLDYPGTPDLTEFGLHNYRIVNENDLSSFKDENNIYQPDSSKIAQLANTIFNTPDLPVLILNGTWIRDRSSNNEAMNSRFEMAYRVFKQHNDKNQFWSFQVSPSSLSGLRVSRSNFFVNLGGWMTSAVQPTRSLRNYVDALLPSSYIVDDDTTLWKKEFLHTIKEAKQNNPDKPVYALFYTDYFNQKENFDDSYNPIKEATWQAMLENAFKLCDGIVIRNIGNSSWNEDAGFWKATKQFIHSHKDNIVFPSDSNSHIPGNTDNIIKNGSFEDSLEPSAIETTFGVDYVAPLRSTGFFDELSQSSNPSSVPTPIADYVWFERGTSQHQCRLNIEHSKSYSGLKSMTIFNVGGSTSDATSKMYAYHNLAQKVSLDDSKKYEFKFHVQRDFEYRNVSNLIDELHVGIISSTGAVSASNSTYYEIVSIPDNEEWNEVSVIFDLPAIIESNPGKSFERCAVFIAMKTGWDSEAGKTLQSKVNVDDISLQELNTTWVRELKKTTWDKYLQINNRELIVRGDHNYLYIYDIHGKAFLQKRSVKEGFTFTFQKGGIYVVNFGTEAFKIFVK